jgi:ABC-type molybdenum transport system ATPase subunit/photorepair protein PhrA
VQHDDITNTVLTLLYILCVYYNHINRETLEEKIRKTRPPPRVRITESSQPGFVSMRLDSIAVTFRNQEVLTDASWEVKTGDRIGLVGPNGGGKTTQMKVRVTA